MASVNKVILVGNCGRDPEIRHLPSGGAVVNLTLATSSKRKDRNSGQVIEDTQWHRLTFFERLAEIAGEYIKKGSPIYVEGRLKYGSYKDKDGVEKPTVEIVVTELQLLGGRETQSGGGQSRGDRSSSQAENRSNSGQNFNNSEGNSRPQQNPQGGGQPSRGEKAAQSPRFDDFEDDIPF